MAPLLTTRAHEAFLKGQYHTSRNLYIQAAERIGGECVQSNLALCERREHERAVHASASDWITYCIPCFNRQSDLKQHLHENLRVISQFPRIRLILNLFDEDETAYKWVQRHFKSEIDGGRLQVNREPALTSWHAAKAKNSFAKYLADDGYYASLDSDNRLTTTDVVRTRQAISEFGPCIIHHFQGEWGDGTCGRLTMPAFAYKNNLPSESVLPRQGEELALLMNALKANPGWPLITRHGVNVLQKSHALRLLITLNRWSVRVIGCALGDSAVPDDAKTSEYARKDPRLSFFTRLNNYYAAYLASTTTEARSEFLRRFQNVQNEFANSDVLISMADLIVRPFAGQPLCERDRRRPQVAVIQSWDEQMRSWLNKQRERGVRRFLLIDATGDPDISRRLNEPGVTWFKPLLGDVETSKDLWLAALNGRYSVTHTSTPEAVWPALRGKKRQHA